MLVPLCCHRYDIGVSPVAITRKLAAEPAARNTLVGCAVIAGALVPPITKLRISVGRVPLKTSESPPVQFVSAYCQKLHEGHGAVLDGAPVCGFGVVG